MKRFLLNSYDTDNAVVRVILFVRYFLTLLHLIESFYGDSKILNTDFLIMGVNSEIKQSPFVF